MHTGFLFQPPDGEAFLSYHWTQMSKLEGLAPEWNVVPPSFLPVGRPRRALKMSQLLTCFWSESYATITFVMKIGRLGTSPALMSAASGCRWRAATGGRQLPHLDHVSPEMFQLTPRLSVILGAELRRPGFHSVPTLLS